MRAGRPRSRGDPGNHSPLRQRGSRRSRAGRRRLMRWGRTSVGRRRESILMNIDAQDPPGWLRPRGPDQGEAGRDFLLPFWITPQPDGSCSGLVGTFSISFPLPPSSRSLESKKSRKRPPSGTKKSNLRMEHNKGMMAPRERGRPARTMPGTASAISPHLDQPGTAPWLSFGLAAAVTADVVAACKAARKLSDHQRDSMRAGRPRSRGQSLPLWRGSRRSRAGRRRLMRRGGEPGRRRGIDIFL